ncbi:hypothetical protein TVAG_109950 [Trichomonas vaginalis G3]|uniref:Uncharacterized protein n=1 Tax=Trichomonas vaginalis (strain ATCC PRA-98 / G3) TaxID=412133 RepID=A2DGJ6_TRIV3|nr:hypothetical protein TVAGG3_0998240 [Trichomonas vaginalis G3]EAY20383.1 hypothetical protein TVAG_109950 [Trichomonas vaginalis G3]KAI5490569.1 hypothetical protein TVAGG3_0998240 [Trichomonas vaginalis G3]|eukprot:XP_001581369.1 hypothetical protein [Trichomonas vaginalis G3]
MFLINDPNAFLDQVNMNDEYRQILAESEEFLQKFNLIKPPVPFGPENRKPKSKQLSIFTNLKTLNNLVPNLLWLPGRPEVMRMKDVNDPRINEFDLIAQKYKVISVFLLYDNQEPGFCAVSFSVPLLTLIYDIRETFKSSLKIIHFPPKIEQILQNPNYKVIIPGKTDFGPSAVQDDIWTSFIQITSLKNIRNLVELTSYYDYLNLIQSGSGLCEHLKLISWVFQIKFEYTKVGSKVRRITDENWPRILHKYGNLLIYLYWVLEEKYENFKSYRKFGVNTDPVYLENLIFNNKLDDDPIDKIKEKLVDKAYPNPPYPQEIARTTKNKNH